MNQHTRLKRRMARKWPKPLLRWLLHPPVIRGVAWDVENQKWVWPEDAKNDER